MYVCVNIYIYIVQILCVHTYKSYRERERESCSFGLDHHKVRVATTPIL